MKITVRGQLHGEPVEATLEDGRLRGDALLVWTIKFAVRTSYPVRLPGVIEGSAFLSEQMPALAAATLYCSCDDGTAELTVEPRPWWLLSGRVASKRRRAAAER